MEIIGIKEVMAMTGRGRATVTRWLNTPGCPTMDREKGQQYLIDKKSFENWFVCQCLKKKKVRL